MGSKVRLFLCVLLALAIMCSAARNTIRVSGTNRMVLEREGRSLKVSTNDYDGPSANRGHDPPSGGRGGRS